MTPIVNHCVMPKDGVNVKTTNTTPSDITFTGLTAGVKYHVSVVCYMLSTSGDNPRLRLTTNGSSSSRWDCRAIISMATPCQKIKRFQGDVMCFKRF